VRNCTEEKQYGCCREIIAVATTSLRSVWDAKALRHLFALVSYFLLAFFLEALITCIADVLLANVSIAPHVIHAIQ
jgi:hypothetical protein